MIEWVVCESRACGTPHGLICGLCEERQWFNRLVCSCSIMKNMFAKVETKEYCFIYC